MSHANDRHPGSLGRVAVVGTGAVGAYYGGRLAQHDQDVNFLLRRDLESWRQSGLRVRSVDGDFTLQPVPCFGSTTAIGPCDLVIIALKATANAVLLEMLPPLMHENTRLLTLQNGLGNDRFLAENFGAHRVSGGLCFVCINRDDDGVIHHLGQGTVVVGNYLRGPDDKLTTVVDAFKAARVPARAAENLAAAQWRKLVWNVPFNGLAVADGGIDCAEILASQARENQVSRLMGEIIHAAAAFGHVLPDGLIDEQITLTRAMGAYRPSTLIDFLAGQPLEVEAIWGEPLRQAIAAGVAMPELQALYSRLKTIG